MASLRYGQIIDGIWKDESKWMSLFQIPDDIAERWINTAAGVSTHHIYCNRDLINPLSEAFVNLRSRDLLDELTTFDGCFHIRNVRGYADSLSAHSWGIAIDVNAYENPIGKDGKMSKEFAQCFIDAGFTWGNHFKRRDPMHFSLGF